MRENEKPVAGGTARGLCGDQLGGEIGTKIGQGMARAQDGQAIYFGDRLIGFLIERRCGFDAVIASGKALGKFNDQAAGARALLAEIGGAR